MKRAKKPECVMLMMLDLLVDMDIEVGRGGIGLEVPCGILKHKVM